VATATQDLSGQLAYFWFFAHLNLLKTVGSTYRSGGGGFIFSLGGVHPYLRQMACTSDPDDHLKSRLDTLG
jgi:hypothetical protein